MFAKVALVALASSVLAAATQTIHPSPQPKSVTISQCNTGDAQCCNTATSATSPTAAGLLGLLGVVVQGVDVLVGLGCTPITIVGGGVSCNQQPICCENNNFNGLINIGCSPITL